MKKAWVFIGLFCLLSNLHGWAAPWAMEGSYKPATVQTPKKEEIGQDFLLRNLLEGKTLKIALIIEKEKKDMFDKYSSLIVQAYYDWFDNAVKHIKKSGREEEFKDVLPYLQQPLSFEVVSGMQEDFDADLKVVVFATKESMREVFFEKGRPKAKYLGVYDLEDKEVGIVDRPYPKSIKRILTHEIGHSLGFADQYYAARWRSDEVYASASFGTIMDSETRELTCEDADGMVNLVDLTLGLVRGGKKGWKSLCQHSQEYYQNGMPLFTNRYRVGFPEEDALVIEEYEDGKRIGATQFYFTDEEVDPFAFVKEVEVLKRNSAGYPALVRGENGEEIYYIRQYERLEKIVTKNGKLISHVYTSPIQQSQHIMALKKFVYNGKIGFLEGEKNVADRPLGVIFKLPSRKIGLMVNLNDRNNEYKYAWTGPWEELFVSENNKTGALNELKIEKAVFQQRVVQWGKEWPQYIHSQLK